MSIREALEDRDYDPLFLGPTRPVMLFGVTHTFFLLNAWAGTQVFMLAQNFKLMGFMLVTIHTLGYLACRYDERIFEVWRVALAKCPRVKNYLYWRCNSYMP